ncbi:MAG: NUDIX domain-containing protein [Bacillota bacterium]|nr:NUDIX domain-containing protein [Bacillota bacterium]
MENELINKKGQTEQQFLEEYSKTKSQYEAPYVTTDNLIFTIGDDEAGNGKRLMLLLIKREDHPYINQWALPGGFIDIKENLEATAERELAEETAVTGIYLEQLYTFGDVGRDPRHRIISASYMALVNSKNMKVAAGDDAKDAKWFNVDSRIIEEKKTFTEKGFNKERLIKISLNNGSEEAHGIIKTTKIVENGRTKKITREIVEKQNIAFDHAMIIEYGLQRLRNKIDYTDIIFNLLDEKFTWSELKTVYELIKGEKRYKDANFRRKFEDMIIETDEKAPVGGGKKGNRPPKLCMFNTDWEE